MDQFQEGLSSEILDKVAQPCCLRTLQTLTYLCLCIDGQLQQQGQGDKRWLLQYPGCLSRSLKPQGTHASGGADMPQAGRKGSEAQRRFLPVLRRPWSSSC